MTDLPIHSTNTNVEIEVDPTANFNQGDMLDKVMKMMNANFIDAYERIANEIAISKQPAIYFTADLCRIYNVSESTIYHYRKSGKLHCCSDGQKVWFTQEHINAFNWLCDSRNKNITIRKMA